MNAAVLFGARLAQKRLDVIPSLGLAAAYDLTHINLLSNSEFQGDPAGVGSGGAGTRTPETKTVPGVGPVGGNTIVQPASTADYVTWKSVSTTFTPQAGKRYTLSWYYTATKANCGKAGITVRVGGIAYYLTADMQGWQTGTMEVVLPNEITSMPLRTTLILPPLPSGEITGPITLIPPYRTLGDNTFWWGGIQANEGVGASPYEKTGDLQTVVDSSGKGLNGTLGLTTAVEATDPLVTPAGLVFDGTDDQVNLSTTIALNPDHTTIYVCTPTSGLATPDHRAVLGVGGTAGNLEYESVVLGASTYKASMSYRLDSDGTQRLYEYGDPIPLNTTSMIANVTSNTDPNLGYVNGVQKFRLTEARRPQTFAQIGHRAAGRNFPGVIHYVAIYNRALSPREIQTVYRILKKRLALRGVILP